MIFIIIIYLLNGPSLNPYFLGFFLLLPINSVVIILFLDIFNMILKT